MATTPPPDPRLDPDMAPPDDGEPAAWLGSPRDMRWLLGIVKSVIVLNVIDAVMTVLWISDRAAVEANPFLYELPQTHPVEFVLVKTGIVSAASWLLWKHRNRAASVVGIFIVFLAYYFLLALHIEALWATFQHLSGIAGTGAE